MVNAVSPNENKINCPTDNQAAISGCPPKFWLAISCHNLKQLLVANKVECGQYEQLLLSREGTDSRAAGIFIQDTAYFHSDSLDYKPHFIEKQ